MPAEWTKRVQPAMLRQALADHPFRVIASANVGHYYRRPPAGPLDPLSGLFEQLAIASGEGEVGAGFRQRQRDRQPDAPIGASYKRHLAG